MLIRPQSLSFRDRLLWAGLGSWFRSPINYFMGFVHVWGHIVRLCVLKCAGHFASSDLWLSLQHSVFYTQAVIFFLFYFFPILYCTVSKLIYLSWVAYLLNDWGEVITELLMYVFQIQVTLPVETPALLFLEIRTTAKAIRYENATKINIQQKLVLNLWLWYVYILFYFIYFFNPYSVKFSTMWPCDIGCQYWKESTASLSSETSE